MSMGGIDCLRPFRKYTIITQHRKFQHHLIHLSVAVATHGNNLILHGVKSLDDAFGIDSLRNAVARSVIEDVAKDEKHVVRAALIEIEHALKGWQAAVYVGNK